MSEVKQEYLYHYTNVSSLASILKNHTIKLNPLTELDDSEEQIIMDEQQHLGKYCFVSSWTDDENESIPMWNMYTNMSEGIRIRLPKNPFVEYMIDGEAYRSVFGIDNDSFDEKKFCSIIPPDKFFKEKYFI